ncbi:hypothetical protein FHS19_006874 [Paenibacillus rhizosphaerae]|uniref:Transcriptional regulator n=1 Tax=Paenibacillus rhizosphaerae TaxID=297318 RepID=A0A839U5P4_9BACL|nr:hypothetical protein [Paenibacillus rhizosphaerae]
MYGLGKNRSLLGRYLDRNKIKQDWLAKEAGLSRNVIGRLCDGERSDDKIQVRSKVLVISALRKNGHDVRAADFWE